MTKKTLANLGRTVKKHRENKSLTLREVAKEIGIGPATLMRVEAGRIPDVDTFGKICHWLNIDPGSFLGFPSQRREHSNPEEATLVSAHLRAGATQNMETVQALARMILVATFRQKPTETDVDT